MAGPGGRSVGRVSVRVVPDSTQFREDLKKVLNRIERTVKATINVDADTRKARAQINALAQELADKDLSLDVSAATEDAKRQIDDLAKNRNITVDADADTGIARLKLATLTRTRFVEIVARLKTSSLAKVNAALAGLSGARVLKSTFSDIGSYLSDLDRHLPKLALISLGVANIGAAALSSVGGLATLSTSLASLSGIVAVLPAMFAGAAISIGVLAAALKDTKKVLGDLGPAFSRLQDTISTNFWDKAAQPIRDLVHGLMPTLQTQLGNVATELGGLTGALARAFQTNLTPSVLTGMMQNLTASIGIAKGAMDPLVQAFVTLGTVGSEYLPRLSAAFVGLSNKFNAFIQKSAQSGQLTEWIDGAIDAFKQLGSIIGSTVGIIGGIGRAAEAAGGGGLKSLAGMLGKVSDVINSGPFQGALTTLFEGAGAAMSGLASALGPIGHMFEGLASTLSGVLAGAGQTVGFMLGKIADALNRPAFKKGLSAFFTGIEAGLKALAPALPALSDMLGTVAQFAGKLGAELGQVLGAAFKALAPIIGKLFTALEPLIPVLGDLLIAAIGALAPVIDAVVASLPFFVDFLIQILEAVTPLLEPIGQLLAALAPLIPVLLQMGGLQIIVGIVQMLAKAFLALLEQVNFKQLASWVNLFVQAFNRSLPVMNMVMQVIGEVIGWLLTFGVQIFVVTGKVIRFVVGMVTKVVAKFRALKAKASAIWNAIKSTIVGAATKLRDKAVAAFNKLKSKITGALSSAKAKLTGTAANLRDNLVGKFNSIKSKITGSFDRAKAKLTGAANRIKSHLSSAFNSAKSAVVGAMGRLASGARNKIGNAVSAVRSIGGKIKSALSGAGSWLSSAGHNIVQGLINGIRGWIYRAANAAANLARSVLNAAKSALGIHSPSKEFAQIGVYSGQGLAQGLKSQYDQVRKAGAAMARAAIPDAPAIDTGITPDESRQSLYGADIRFNIYNPVNEPTSETARKASAYIAAAV